MCSTSAHRPPDPRVSLDAALAWLLGRGHHSLLDAGGRLLGERASPHYFAHPVEERHRRFGDLRDETGLPYNAAALRETVAVWPRLIATFAAWPARPSMAGVFARVHAARSFAPLYALRTGEAPSVEAAVLFKTSLGYGELLMGILLTDPELADAVPWTPAELWDELSRVPWLVGMAQVCAGTRAQILEAWAALTSFDAAAEGIAGWREPWFVGASAALRELELLLLAAAGAARASPASREPSLALRLAEATHVPRMARALRQVPGAGPLHASLLCASDEVFESLRDFLEALPADGALGAVDAALLSAARGPVARLAAALGLPDTTFSSAAFIGACVDDRDPNAAVGAVSRHEPDG